MTRSEDRLQAAWVTADAGFERLQREMAAGGGGTRSAGAPLHQAWAVAVRLLTEVLEVVAHPRGADGPVHLPSAVPNGIGAGPLVAALRERGLCTLDEAHVLIDLHAASERAATDAERGLGVGELAEQQLLRSRGVLERIVRTAQPSTAPREPLAPPDRPSIASPPPGPVASPVNPDVSGRRSSLFVLALVACCLIGAGVTAVLFTGVGRADPVAEGVAAYEAGQRTAARVAFEQARVADSTAAVPLMYLGRLAREEGDFTEARRLLEQAVQKEPQNALTHRELAGALLADGEPELARRFYVRTLTLNADDRVAQGFLACALHRLGRDEEAVRWSDRAGRGDWSPCLDAPPPSPTTRP